MYMTPEQAARGVEQFYKIKNSNLPPCGRASDYAVDLSLLKAFN
jgi:hypothetical protein